MDNKLGEGGFGEVYKGVLENGQEIAVKRLSKNSGQGTAEFNTEIVVVAKLQHKNLVKLLGFCLAPKEKILVYEYLPNSSLDRCISDNDKRLSMAWETRFKIINGIARGLLYLHEDSRLKIVHRDLKPSNILLDAGMNPKIADFGLAKLFEVDQTQGDTNKIVGTYGYLAPEYAMTGHFSVKSDVYSFGVIILEILSGQRNRFFNRPQLEEALLHRAWRHWNEGSPLNLVDTLLGDSYPREEVTKCIHIAILCIQDNAIERPRMASVVAALSGQSISLPMPKAPTFFGDLKTTVAELHYNQLDENIQDIVYRQTKTIRKNSPSSYSGTEGITELYPR
ncbi:hypothetical protein vseg_011288 [Gypsophila vaccaria]